ncbi:hypothetical protein P154DRAFT_427531 [Amniculicola lignicola CBS 123094]|uniref:LITAF domain-containing protein n=1 Tax=Amniculicola lignicola CBS 123094 TaxID=1392246 RepID=A0A6A5WV45_9PLEO|nr:hypothetical protein P154DRAFT_427531 [Amniculicola lignicola CBS 123094]
MGVPTTPAEAAPAYDDVFADHPVNGHPPSGSSRAYSAVPQDDVELQAHTHGEATPGSSIGPAESIAQTIAGVFRPKPHVHCDQCDVQLEARERRANEKHCCSMVALTFIAIALCLMILGIVVAKTKRH